MTHPAYVEDIGYHHAYFWDKMFVEYGVNNPFMLDAYAKECAVLIANEASTERIKKIAEKAISLWSVAENFGTLVNRTAALINFLGTVQDIEVLIVALFSMKYEGKTQQYYIDCVAEWESLHPL